MSSASVIWSTSDAAILDITAAGQITTTGVGEASITALAATVADTFDIEVVSRRQVPIAPYLGTPAPGALWEIPVDIVAYIPTADGVNVDPRFGLAPAPADAINHVHRGTSVGGNAELCQLAVGWQYGSLLEAFRRAVPRGAFITGRAGRTHMPPNTTGNYDCLNATLVPSDIQDWRPDETGNETLST